MRHFTTLGTAKLQSALGADNFTAGLLNCVQYLWPAVGGISSLIARKVTFPALIVHVLTKTPSACKISTIVFVLPLKYLDCSVRSHNHQVDPSSFVAKLYGLLNNILRPNVMDQSKSRNEMVAVHFIK